MEENLLAKIPGEYIAQAVSSLPPEKVKGERATATPVDTDSHKDCK